MDTIVVAVLGALLVAAWISAAAAIVSAARSPASAWKVAHRSRLGTMLGIVCSCGVGGLYYWLSIRPAVSSAAAQVPPPPRRDAWSNDDW